MFHRFRSLVLFGVFAGILPIYGSTIAYINPASAGAQNWAGNLALDFTVNSPITVTALGVFNALGDGTITGLIQVAIFNTDTNTQVTPTVSFHGNYTPAGSGFDVFQSIAPIVLGPGHYLVDAVGFGPTDQNGNYILTAIGPALDTGGGLLSFTGAEYDSNTSLDAPSSCAGCQSSPSPQNQQFDAGTFQFDAVGGVPEPGSISLTVFGLGCVVAAWRRKQSQRA